MWGRGVAAMPAAGARINTIVHSIMRPFKVGDSLGQFGVITQDRLPAIGVMVGPTAPMYPLRVTVDDPTYQGQRTLNMRIWMDREQSANYLTVALVESVDAIARASSDASTDIQYTLRFSDGTEVQKSRFITDSMGGILPVVLMAAEVGAVTNNPFLPVQPVSVEVRVRSGYHRAQAQIERLEFDRQWYRPGDMVRVAVSLRPWRGDVQTREWTFTVPGDLPDGTYQLQVGDSSSREMLEAMLEPGLTRINSYEGLMRLVKRNFAENRLYLTVADQMPGASVDGVALERLPGSVLATLSATAPSRDFAPIRGNLVIDQDQATPYQIMGALNKSLIISRKKNP
jgi:hypothetical protein